MVTAKTELKMSTLTCKKKLVNDFPSICLELDWIGFSPGIMLDSNSGCLWNVGQE